MSWRCTVCKRPRQEGDATAHLLPSLTDRYMTGKCVKCRARRHFEHFEPEIYRPPDYRSPPLYAPGTEEDRVRSSPIRTRAERILAAGTQDGAMGDRLKERGMGRAEVSEELSASGWNDRADAAIRALALLRLPFTSEDVTKRVGLPARSTGAVGARMNTAARRGIIHWTGQMASAKRPNQHSALLKVWRGA